MNRPLILTYDVGTQSTRAILVDKQGNIVDKEQVKYAEPYFRQRPGWAEQKTDFYFDNMCKASTALMARNADKVPDIIAELVTGKLDGAFIETMVAESYATQYPELCLVLEVPYDAEGSVVGVTKGNAALLEGVNRAIAAAKEDGSFDQYVLTANELASGDIIEGLVDENGEAVQ